jgi:CubicO group peptidase (beta-lactamase class C family)
MKSHAFFRIIPPPGRIFPLSAIALAFLAFACADAALWPDPVIPPVPAQLFDGWAVGAPEDHGFDPNPIALLDLDIRSGRISEVDALLIARHGVLVYEGYFNPATSVHKLHQLNSVTKSVVSMAVGVAIQQGLIDGYDQPIRELLPDYDDIFQAEPEKGEITLRHLLTMTAGLAWDDKDPSSQKRDGILLHSASDAARYVLEKPLVDKPGSRFLYSGGATQLLATILSEVGGESTDGFIYHELLHRILIEQYEWTFLSDGSVDAAGGLFMRARDLAALGQLYLMNGDWNGRLIMSPEWVQDSFQPWIASSTKTARYGFQWWMYPYSPRGSSTRPYGLIVGSGYGGQKLFIVPELDLVAVFFGCTTEGYDCGISDTVPEAVMYNYILRALDAG